MNEMSDPVVRKWSKPSADWLKINANGAYNYVGRSGGWGFVIRNDHGAVVKSGARRIENCADAMHAKALAAFQALICVPNAEMTQVTPGSGYNQPTGRYNFKWYDLTPIRMIIKIQNY